MTMAHLFLMAVLWFVTCAHAGSFDSLSLELNMVYARASDTSDSSIGIVRVWSLLESTPSLGKIDSIYVPSAFTVGSPAGPSRILILPDAFYSKSLVEILRRRLSTRLTSPTPVAVVCTGEAEPFTDCCTHSPHLSCLEDERLLGGDSTLPPLRDPLYGATAMDLFAVELRQNTASLSAAELKQSRLKANTLFLLFGMDYERPGRYLLVELDNPLLTKLSFLITRIEGQVAKRRGQSSRLTGTLICTSQSWRAVPRGNTALPSDWLSGSTKPSLRGPAGAPFFWTGLGAESASLLVTGMTSDSAASTRTMFDFYKGTAGRVALSGCLGDQVVQTLDQAQPLLGILRAPDVSGFFANWLFLFGALSVLSM